MERQSERKNNRSKAVIIIVAMLLMVALVVGMGAMTYSRYITSESTGSQTATVAKWGFVVTVDANNLLGKNYDKGSGDLATIVTSDGVAVSASSSVVAPGTTGSMTITVSGRAEVLAQLKISSSGDEIRLGDYRPIKWTLKKGDAVVGTDGNKLENLTLAQLNDKISQTNEKFTPNPSTDYSVTYTLSWKWDFGSDDETNAKDTIIGYKQAGKAYNDIKDLKVGVKVLGELVSADNYNKIATDNSGHVVTEMSFDLTVSVEQIQE